MKNLKKILIFSIVIFTVILITGCKDNSKNSNLENTKNVENQSNLNNENKIKITVSTYPAYDFAKRIGKDKVEIKNLVPNGVNIHTFEPNLKDMAYIKDSDLFIYMGLNLQGFCEKAKEDFDLKNTTVLNLSDFSYKLKGEHHHHDEKEEVEDKNHVSYDPHIWLSMKNAISMMEAIKDNLVKLDEKNADFYEENFKIEKEKFQQLDEKFKRELEPYKNRYFVVSHKAFTYLANDYNLKQEGIEGIEENSEPDLNKMASIIDFIKANKIKVIFTQSFASEKPVEEIAKETGTKILPLNPIIGLTKEEEENNEDYLSLMEKNVNNLIESFK